MCRGAIRRCLALDERASLAVVVDDPSVLGPERARVQAVPVAARQRWLHDPAHAEARPFAQALAAADGVATTGHGAFIDLIASEAIEHLTILASAANHSATALLGHGVGPFADAELRAAASRVLPTLDLICVRERDLALPLLASLGVAPERVAVTGDDAFEIAARRGFAGLRRRDAIGVSLRLSGIDRDQALSIAEAARHLAKSAGLALQPLPIDHSDPAILGQAGLPTQLPREIEPLLRSARRCRVIVAGSYHACVFGLAQGAAVVAIAATDFYRGKMGGLATWFPGACEVVDAGSGELESRVGAALRRALDRVPGQRAASRRAVRWQVAAGRGAWKRFSRLASAKQAQGAAVLRVTAKGRTS